MGTDEVVIKVEFINFYRFYIADELLFEYKDEELYNWIDRDWFYKTVNLEEFISNNKPMEVLDCLLDTDIIKYLELKGYKVSE